MVEQSMTIVPISAAGNHASDSTLAPCELLVIPNTFSPSVEANLENCINYLLIKKQINMIFIYLNFDTKKTSSDINQLVILYSTI